MRNLLALIGLVVVGFAAIGWYCGWYKITVTNGTEGKPEVKTTVNTDKVTEDSTAFFKRMGQLVSEKAKQTESQDGQPSVAPSNTPGPIAPVKGDVPIVPGKAVGPIAPGRR